ERFYTQSTYLQLVHYTGGGNYEVLATSDYADLDPGSRTENPFIDYEFTQAGTYAIMVGSFKVYADEVFNSQNVNPVGVAAGLSYKLNVSIQRHKTNPSAISLIGKQVEIVEGTGIGQTAEIVGYDALTNTYTIDTKWTGAFDNTSRFEVSYHMADEFPSYVPVSDTYQVVLTRAPAPGTQVIIDVTPYITRTYNSDLAFVDAANNGENEAIQVIIDTPQLVFDEFNWDTPQIVTVWAIDDDIIDGGDAKAFSPMDERINSLRGPVTFDGGVRYSDERSLNDPFTLPEETNWPLPDGSLTAVDMTDGLLSLSDLYATHVDSIRGEMPGFDPRMNDYDYVFTILEGVAADIDLNVDSLTGNAVAIKPESATDDFTVTIPTDSAGTMAIKGTVIAGYGYSYSSAAIVFSSPIYLGQEWILTLDSTDYNYTINETDGVSLTALANGLAALIATAGYAPTVSGSVLNLSKSGGFTAQITGGNAKITGIADSTAEYSMAEVHLSGQVSAGQIWKIQLDSDVYTYTAQAGDTLTDIALGLAQAIDQNADNIYHADIIYDTVLFTETAVLDGAVPSIGEGYFYIPINPNILVTEEDQVDVINVRNGNSPSDDSGVLTQDRLYGFGMGSDIIIGDRLLNGGI
ncbi:MAG: hypothetical protein KAJ19_20460, partial [Gammaproteobacteria bacterium]|nr:hypothetical protein [Gammaproteobacteria bacterium]